MLIHRAQLEENERHSLAAYALCSGDSRGRRQLEPEARYRTAFQRDRDRIVHAAAFRRLEYKTQVFVNEAGDYFRTRLTHTLEVAQIGRSLARALACNEDLVEAICLAHDLGHPPFGHAGEQALDALLAQQGGFNHNLQSYRIVTVLEQRYPHWQGLNLTLETLEGIAQHDSNFDRSQLVGINAQGGASLEAQIAHIADELAYNAHDLDDGLHSQLLQPEQLQSLALWRQAADAVGWRGSQVLDALSRHQIIRELLGICVEDVLQETQRQLAQHQPSCAQALQQLAEPLVRQSPDFRAQSAALKAFLEQSLYRHSRIMRMQARAQRITHALFTSMQAEPLLLPAGYRARLDADPLQLVIADYIACMTDRSALRDYQQLYAHHSLD